MQQINANISLTGSGSATLWEGWRDAQAALRALHQSKGLTSGTSVASQTARPVMAVEGAERKTIMTPARPDVLQPLNADRDAPAGPSPTFQRTPLEQLRSEAMDPNSSARRAASEANTALALGRWDTTLSKQVQQESTSRPLKVEESDVHLDVRT